MGCLQLSYYEDLTGFTEVSRLKICYVNPKLRAENNTSFLGVVLEGVKGAGTDPSLTWKTPVGAGTVSLFGGIISKSSKYAKAIWSESRWIGKGSTSRFTSTAALYFRRTRGHIAPKVKWFLPKALSYGGQLGRLSSRFLGPVGWGLLMYDVGCFMHDSSEELIRTKYNGDRDQWYQDMSGGYGMKCFIAGTKITMSDGDLKNIEDVEKGDVVKTYNLETKKIEDNLVLEMESPNHSDLVEVGFEKNIENTNTFDHPYYVKGKGWSSYKPDETLIKYGLKASQLEVGDLCYLYKDDSLIEIKIISLKENVRLEKTYNLSSVANNNNFFANGILVHNKFISTTVVSDDALIKKENE